MEFLNEVILIFHRSNLVKPRGKPGVTNLGSSQTWGHHKPGVITNLGSGIYINILTTYFLLLRQRNGTGYSRGNQGQKIFCDQEVNKKELKEWHRVRATAEERHVIGLLAKSLCGFFMFLLRRNKDILIYMPDPIPLLFRYVTLFRYAPGFSIDEQNIYSIIKNMKTSLMIEDSLFKAAQREAQKTGKTISDTISYWARVGRERLHKKKDKLSLSQLKPVDLGGPSQIDLNCRRDWIDTLDS